MSWGPFKSEAKFLYRGLRTLIENGQEDDAVSLIERQLANTYAYGPTNTTCEAYVKELERREKLTQIK